MPDSRFHRIFAVGTNYNKVEYDSYDTYNNRGASASAAGYDARLCIWVVAVEPASSAVLNDKPEGVRSHLSKTAMLAFAVTIHNLPEGMAVGVVFAGAENGASSISLASAVTVALGIAIQNIPEGAIISMPMRAAGNSRWKSFVLGTLSGVVEPIGAIAVMVLASLLLPALPYMLAFAAGAMFYVVVEELIPEASSGAHSNLSTIGFAIGFVLMMVLDVVMG